MPLPRMLKASLAGAEKEEIRREGVEGIIRQVIDLDGVMAKKVRFEPGGVTKACPHAHVAYVLSGAIRIRMNDGAEETFAAGDVMMLPPGHDAWTIGDEACEFIEFSQGTQGYYGPPVHG